eukprot:GHVT01078290.1.p1 GENE.GHVT01078290.1~~GHVT01078290.1.p1  ORF type:complete len:384 (+),score=23.97 GHVT01078290.1:288-1439(+)
MEYAENPSQCRPHSNGSTEVKDMGEPLNCIWPNEARTYVTMSKSISTRGSSHLGSDGQITQDAGLRNNGKVTSRSDHQHTCKAPVRYVSSTLLVNQHRLLFYFSVRLSALCLFFTALIILLMCPLDLNSRFILASAHKPHPTFVNKSVTQPLAESFMISEKSASSFSDKIPSAPNSAAPTDSPSNESSPDTMSTIHMVVPSNRKQIMAATASRFVKFLRSALLPKLAKWQRQKRRVAWRLSRYTFRFSRLRAAAAAEEGASEGQLEKLEEKQRKRELTQWIGRLAYGAQYVSLLVSQGLISAICVPFKFLFGLFAIGPFKMFLKNTPMGQNISYWRKLTTGKDKQEKQLQIQRQYNQQVDKAAAQVKQRTLQSLAIKNSETEK